jgi:hypothetical protein
MNFYSNSNIRNKTFFDEINIRSFQMNQMQANQIKLMNNLTWITTLILSTSLHNEISYMTLIYKLMYEKQSMVQFSVFKIVKREHM